MLSGVYRLSMRMFLQQRARQLDLTIKPEMSPDFLIKSKAGRIRRIVEHGPSKELLLALPKLVASLHDSKIVHQDIKPENIGIALDGSVVLLDLPDTCPDATTAFTLRYAAPERMAGVSQVSHAM